MNQAELLLGKDIIVAYNEYLQSCSNEELADILTMFTNMDGPSRHLRNKFEENCLRFIKQRFGEQYLKEQILVLNMLSNEIYSARSFGNYLDNFSSLEKFKYIVCACAGTSGVEPISIAKKYKDSLITAIDPELIISPLDSVPNLNICKSKLSSNKNTINKADIVIASRPCEGFKELTKICCKEKIPFLGTQCPCEDSNEKMKKLSRLDSSLKMVKPIHGYGPTALTNISDKSSFNISWQSEKQSKSLDSGIKLTLS